jgi:hypothetical protein
MSHISLGERIIEHPFEWSAPWEYEDILGYGEYQNVVVGFQRDLGHPEGSQGPLPEMIGLLVS